MRALGGKDMQSRFPWRKLDTIYLWMVAPLILAMVYILPPFQAPDEAAHFYRAVQISHGQFRPAIAPPTYRQGAGGSVDTAAYQLVDRYCGMPNWNCARQDRPTLAALAAGSPPGPLQTVSFSNTVVYLPIAHVVPAVGIAIARAAGLNPLAWLYAGRVVAALFAIAMSWLALRLLRDHSASALVFAVAALPMVSSISPTLSADSGVVSCSLLLFALCATLLEGSPFGWPLCLALVITVFYASAAKLAYLPLALLPLGCAISGRRSRTVVITTALVALCAIGTTLLWSSAIREYVFPISQDLKVDPEGQLVYIRGHPVAFALTIGKSMIVQAPFAAITLIGRKLSDLRVLLPWAVVAMSAVTLAAGAITSGSRRVRLPLHLFAFVIVAGCAAATFLFLYVQNSAVGSTRVEAYQGRYLIPLLPFLAFVVPPVRPLESIRIAARSWVGFGGTLATISVALFLTVRTWG